MNTWVWSTAFHARDNLITERLDYFCATFSILYLLTLASIRIFNIQRRNWPLIIVPLVIYFSWHCYTMHFHSFDYGWNMDMMIFFGSLYCGLYYVWFAIQKFTNNTQHHHWKIVTANSIILFFAAFEVFDFPPLFGLLDAHAIWHFATPTATLLTFSFAIDDSHHLDCLKKACKAREE
jgi:hypothetical protein